MDLLKFQVAFLHGILYGVVQMLLPKAALDLFNRDFAWLIPVQGIEGILNVLVVHDRLARVESRNKLVVVNLTIIVQVHLLQDQVPIHIVTQNVRCLLFELLHGVLKVVNHQESRLVFIQAREYLSKLNDILLLSLESH